MSLSSSKLFSLSSSKFLKFTLLQDPEVFLKILRFKDLIVLLDISQVVRKVLSLSFSTLLKFMLPQTPEVLTYIGDLNV